MKSIVKKSLAVTIVVFMLIMTAIPFASAATLLDESKKVSFKVSCDKPGYAFRRHCRRSEVRQDKGHPSQARQHFSRAQRNARNGDFLRCI